MITSTMNREEVNNEIIRVLPKLMKMIISKTKHRAHKARKKGLKDEVSSYEIEGVIFGVYYFIDKGEDVSIIFCRYHDNKGAIYAYVNVFGPGNYSILHFLKHAIDQYNTRLGLGFGPDETKNIIFHMARHGITMARIDLETIDKDWLDVGWKSENCLWLGQSENKIPDSSTHVSIVKTFINEELARKDQEAVLDDEKLDMLVSLEQEIGGDEYARRRIVQLIDLFNLKK